MNKQLIKTRLEEVRHKVVQEYDAMLKSEKELIEKHAGQITEVHIPFYELNPKEIVKVSSMGKIIVFRLTDNRVVAYESQWDHDEDENYFEVVHLHERRLYNDPELLYELGFIDSDIETKLNTLIIAREKMLSLRQTVNTLYDDNILNFLAKAIMGEY